MLSQSKRKERINVYEVFSITKCLKVKRITLSVDMATQHLQLNVSAANVFSVAIIFPDNNVCVGYVVVW